MTGKTHAFLGTATMAAICIRYASGLSIMGSEIYPVVSLLSVSAGSYMPDIDINQSKLGSKHKFLSKHLTHRGITHTLLIPAVLLMGMYYLPKLPLVESVLFGFVLGWLAHILADLFNAPGVPLLWPFISSRISFGKVKTGSWQEYLFAAVWTGGLILWLIKY